MIHCIVGAILACHNYAAIYIDGPVAYGVRQQPNYAWTWAAYGAPPLRTQSFPVAFPIARRG